MLKNKIIFILLIVLTLLSSCGKEEELVVKKYYETTTVSTGSIGLETSYIGYTDSFEKINVSGKVGGQITGVYALEGDKIKKGQLLAELDGNEAKAGIQSNINIINSIDDLYASTSEVFDKEIKVMEAKIETLKASLSGNNQSINNTENIGDASIETIKSQIIEAETGLEVSKNNYEETKKTLETKEDNIYKNIKSSIIQSVILYTNIIDYSDSLLGVTDENEDKNNDIEDYLGKKDTNNLNNTESNFKNVNNLYLEYKSLYETKIENKNPTKADTLLLIEKGTFLAEEIKVLLKDIYNVLDTSIENVYFSKETINNNKNTISTFGENVESSLLSISGDYLLGLKGGLENINNFKSEYSKTLSNLEKQITVAEKRLETANKLLEQNLEINKGQLSNVSVTKDITEKQINEAKVGLELLKKEKENKLKEIKSSIEKVKGEKKQNEVSVGNTKVFSPIDGIVLEKLANLGEITNPLIPIFTVASDEIIKIDVGIPEETAKKLKVGDSVIIELQEINNPISGVIKNIFPSKDKITKKINIEISIENKEKNIRLGSMAKVFFIETKQYGIVIPNKAIISKFMIPGVLLKDGDTAKFYEIEILKQNDNFSVVKGIEVGKEIIIKGQENIYDGEVIK